VAGRVPLDGCDESIAHPRNGFEVPGLLGALAQRLTNLLDRKVDPVLEVDEGVLPPERLLDLRSGDDFTRAGGQEHQELRGLGLEPDLPLSLPELARAAVELVISKRDPMTVVGHDARGRAGERRRIINPKSHNGFGPHLNLPSAHLPFLHRRTSIP
jgi:hypothetical protein